MKTNDLIAKGWRCIIIFNSNADEIKYYFRQLLDDGNTHSRPELFSYVQTHSPRGREFSEGMKTGALKTLTDGNSPYKKVGYGIYQKATGASGTASAAQLITQLQDVLRRTHKELSDILDNSSYSLSNYLSLNETDLQSLQTIKHIMSEMEEITH